MHHTQLPSACRNALQSIAQHLQKNQRRPSIGMKLKTFHTPSQISQMFKPFIDLPYSPDIESLRGYCLQSIHKHQLALYVYEEVLARSPLHAPTLRRKGELLKIMNKLDESSACFSLASLLEPDNLHLEILGQESEEQDEEESQIQEEKENAWTIKIKSIDRLPTIKSSKSVLFKSELLQQAINSQCHLNIEQPIKSKKSILKARSFQQNSNLVSGKPDRQIVSMFDIKKIRSIDGKMSTGNSNNSKKQIIFSYGEVKNNQPSESCTGLKRKSSIMTKSKIINPL